MKDLPGISQSLPPEIRTPLERLNEAVSTLLGFRGDPTDWAVRRDTVATLLRNVTPGTTIINNGDPAEEPDLSPPPDVTGLAATAGFANVIVSWAAPTYTQGHGHQKTNLYAVKKAASDPSLPTFSSATRVAEATGALTIFALPSDLSIRWHVWAKYETVDGVESLSPAGGVNGVTAQTGVVDGTDLAPLIIEARHLRAANPGVFPDQTFEGGSAVWDVAFKQRIPSTHPVAPPGAPFPFIAEFQGRDGVSWGYPVTVFPGEQYRLSLYVNRSGLSTQAAGVVAYVTDAAGTVLATPVGQTTANGWQRVEAKFQVPAGAVRLLIGPWISQAHGGLLATWFTGLLLEKMVDASLVTTNMITAGSGAISALAIEHAMIGGEAVDNSNIANLSAAKLTVGDGTVGGNLKSANFVSGNAGAGWLLRPDGYFEATNAIFRGTIVAASGTISGINIGPGWLESTNFDHGGGNSGFSFNSDGTVYCNNLVAKGNITATSGKIGNINIGSGWVESADFAAGVTGFSLNSDGNAYFRNVTASGNITAKTITADNILNGVLRDPNQPGMELVSAGSGIYYTHNTGWSDVFTSATCTDDFGTPYECGTTTRVGVVMSGTEVRFTTSDSSTPVQRRLRTGTVRFQIVASAVVDGYLSLYYRRSSPTWLHVAVTNDFGPGYGNAVIQSILTMNMGVGEAVEFGISPVNAAGAFVNSGFPELLNASILVNITNL
jgi:hypothetical protein